MLSLRHLGQTEWITQCVSKNPLSMHVLLDQRLTSHTPCPCSMSRPAKCQTMSGLQGCISVKVQSENYRDSKTSKLRPQNYTLKKRSCPGHNQIAPSKIIWSSVLHPDFKGMRGEQKGMCDPKFAPKAILASAGEDGYFSLVFLPFKRREFRISSLPQPLPPGGPRKQYFPAQQGKTSNFYTEVPCCRQISPASYFLTTEPWLFCNPGAHQGRSRNERTKAVSAALGPRSLAIKFFNEHESADIASKY